MNAPQSAGWNIFYISTFVYKFSIIIALKTTLGIECDHAVLHRCNFILFVRFVLPEHCESGVRQMQTADLQTRRLVSQTSHFG